MKKIFEEYITLLFNPFKIKPIFSNGKAYFEYLSGANVPKEHIFCSYLGFTPSTDEDGLPLFNKQYVLYIKRTSDIEEFTDTIVREISKSNTFSFDEHDYILQVLGGQVNYEDFSGEVFELSLLFKEL